MWPPCLSFREEGVYKSRGYSLLGMEIGTSEAEAIWTGNSLAINRLNHDCSARNGYGRNWKNCKTGSTRCWLGNQPMLSFYAGYHRNGETMARIPSMQALRALESVARLGSIWQAAEELNLTRSAVSHQLRLLERELDFRVLNRSGNRIELSARALDYAMDVRRALSMLAASSNRHAGDMLSGPLAVSCPPGFLAGWLSLRLGSFAEKYPDVTIMVVTPRRLDSTNNPEVDTFITFGHDNRHDVIIEPLQPVEFTPLCSPGYLQRIGGLPDADALRRATLLHIGDFSDWENWMRRAGGPSEQAQRGICFSDMSSVQSAALAGQGIAIGDVVIWRNALESGKLVRPFAEHLHSDTGYYLCTHKEKLHNPVVASFHTWLKEELRNISSSPCVAEF